jgi:hypothetical protein
VPTGLGWFVQNYNGEALIWQFGQIRDGHSALFLSCRRAASASSHSPTRTV